MTVAVCEVCHGKMFLCGNVTNMQDSNLAAPKAKLRLMAAQLCYLQDIKDLLVDTFRIQASAHQSCFGSKRKINSMLGSDWRLLCWCTINLTYRVLFVHLIIQMIFSLNVCMRKCILYCVFRCLLTHLTADLWTGPVETSLTLYLISFPPLHRNSLRHTAGPDCFLKMVFSIFR